MFKIKKNFPQANVSKTVRFTEELNAKLTALAHGEHISFNELILRCCQYALDNYDGNINLENIGSDIND